METYGNKLYTTILLISRQAWIRAGVSRLGVYGVVGKNGGGGVTHVRLGNIFL